MNDKEDASEKRTVNHPSHYAGTNGVECIDAIEAALTPEQFDGFLAGNALKYLFRADRKHESHDEDLEKALWYINRRLRSQRPTTGERSE